MSSEKLAVISMYVKYLHHLISLHYSALTDMNHPNTLVQKLHLFAELKNTIRNLKLYNSFNSEAERPTLSGKDLSAIFLLLSHIYIFPS